MEEKEIRDELTSIRSLMERSSKFISLSGLSGVLAGIYALIGAGIAYSLLKDFPIANRVSLITYVANAIYIVLNLIIIALIVLSVSILTAFILSKRKAKKRGQSIWGKASQIVLLNMAVPLLTGGAFIVILFYHGLLFLVIPSMLLFYGVALVSAGNFTFTMVKYLGICEIILGLIAACLPGYGLLFWALGFGVLHIIYGSIMYFKYDK
jgi:MFS family permease